MRRGPSLAGDRVNVQPGKDLAETERLVYAEIERLKREPVADWEMEKVRIQLDGQRAQPLLSTISRAVTLGQYALYYNDPGLVNTIRAKLGAVTKDDIRRVARTYLKETNRTVVMTVPKPEPAPARPGE